MACAPLHIRTCAFAILRQVVGRRLIRQEISILIITYNFPCLSHFHTLNNYKKENSPNQIGKEKMQKKNIYPFQRWIKFWVYFSGLSSRSTRVLWILHLLCGYARCIFFSITSRHLYLPCDIAPSTYTFRLIWVLDHPPSNTDSMWLSPFMCHLYASSFTLNLYVSIQFSTLYP